MTGETVHWHSGTRSTQGLAGSHIVRADVPTLVAQLAQDLAQHAARCVRERGTFQIALSGGSSPGALYEYLSHPERAAGFPWAKTHVWVVDERCVPSGDPANNSDMLRRLLVEPLAPTGVRFHALDAISSGCAERYEAELRHHLTAAGGRLDWILLGMGADGHTASLFPHTAALSERVRWLVSNDGASVAAPRPRVTMTFPVINQAREIAVLVTGESKASMLAQVALAATSTESVAALPITGVQPGSGAELRWYLDAAAAQADIAAPLG